MAVPIAPPLGPREWRDCVEANWLTALVGLATTVTLLGTGISFARNPFYVSADSALFQHGGWYITEGARLYVDIWDLKPPLVYGVTTVLATISLGNMHVLHLLSIAVSVAAVVAGVTFVGLTTHRLTDNGLASLAAGATMFVVPSVYAYPSAGIRPKYFAFACAAGALLLAIDERPAASGAVAAAATLFWQLGGPVALLVVAIGWQRSGRTGFWRTVVGGLAVTAVVLLPFVLAGLAVPLFVEVVLAPLYGVENYTVVGRLLRFVYELGYGALLLPVGAVGWYRGVAADLERYWWVAAGGTIYVLQLFLELQGAIETILLLLFLALGVGLLVDRAETPDAEVAAGGVVVLLVVASAYWGFAADPLLKETVGDLEAEHSVPAYPELPPDPEQVPPMDEIYWEKQRPALCHYRLGHKQKYFEYATGGTLYRAECGQWPYEEPPRGWLLGPLG